jgi:hypothetical protein
VTLNPGSPFLDNWHIEAIAYRLEQVRTGKVTRLIINLPPRSLKSVTVSVAFAAFLLGHDPRRKIFGISYATCLQDARDFRSIVQSNWTGAYSRAEAYAIGGDRRAHDQRGFRKATSINALTGLGDLSSSTIRKSRSMLSLTPCAITPISGFRARCFRGSTTRRPVQLLSLCSGFTSMTSPAISQKIQAIGRR